mmetsp:Transcript_12397/g.40836  ORF Transcript_12397/g.40836 Transcript_12397/m.40836 type:complete len:342 (-) Transcript_12397:124-1149(-)
MPRRLSDARSLRVEELEVPRLRRDDVVDEGARRLREAQEEGAAPLVLVDFVQRLLDAFLAHLNLLRLVRAIKLGCKLAVQHRRLQVRRLHIDVVTGAHHTVLIAADVEGEAVWFWRCEVRSERVEDLGKVNLFDAEELLELEVARDFAGILGGLEPVVLDVLPQGADDALARVELEANHLLERLGGAHPLRLLAHLQLNLDGEVLRAGALDLEAVARPRPVRVPTEHVLLRVEVLRQRHLERAQEGAKLALRVGRRALRLRRRSVRSARREQTPLYVQRPEGLLPRRPGRVESVEDVQAHHARRARGAPQHRLDVVPLALQERIHLRLELDELAEDGGIRQ